MCLVPGASQTKTPSSSLAILFRFDGSTSEVGFQEMRRQLQFLMGPSHVQPEWRNRASVTASDSFDRLVVVDFHGQCRMEAGYAVSGAGVHVRAVAIDYLVSSPGGRILRHQTAITHAGGRL